MSPARQTLEPATMSEQDGVRYLHLGTPWVQGAMRVRKPQAIELEYVQRMMAWMLWRPQDEVNQGHAVQLGLDVHTLPSTSPANASWSFERKLAAWREVFSRYDLAPQTETAPR